MNRAAVIGHPIDHSRSPLLHSTAYALLGAQIDYGRLDAQEADAATVAGRLRTEPGWVGLSVTMPMKAAMLAHMDTLDPLARALGALNTVVVSHLPDGGGVRLHGANTDVVGVQQAVAGGGVASLEGEHCLILGGGGTAAAALAGVQLLGCTDVSVAVREPQRAAGLAALGQTLGVKVAVTSLTTMTGPEPRVVISTLPPRAADPFANAVAQRAAQGSLLMDVAYAPWPSALATAWAARGGVVVHGLAMLVHQAVEQIALFTGLEAARSPQILGALCDAADITVRGEPRGAVGG
ncbi:shikimate dehydrogenase family protein [Galactobacter caseinivorans]|uniref:Shikimate dehydrogenase n=1 Tax=Galactobacter caseinivorans TaxID=2676123 RepID=A0A496PL25_9MICC|nr:NAD(P)-binding domain-containing protein [Galactobacter caseinivorans]RKW71198.1 shikimate dehydrogenase [Galactobacter caseinivorans]